uniref:GlgA protein n=1 Tax=Fopius arisanus TaxID=64838 RepID=A0A0C9REQ8_9HYME
MDFFKKSAAYRQRKARYLRRNEEVSDEENSVGSNEHDEAMQYAPFQFSPEPVPEPADQNAVENEGFQGLYGDGDVSVSTSRTGSNNGSLADEAQSHSSNLSATDTLSFGQSLLSEAAVNEHEMNSREIQIN